MNRKKILIIMLGVLLLTTLLTCGKYGIRLAQRIRLHHKAIAAYENREYAAAEGLLLQYVKEDPDAKDAFVALANIYHEFGNVEMESQMWQSVNSLDPQNQEYREKMLTSALESANYARLHGILSREARVNKTLPDQELYLYVISSYRSGYPTDGNEAYKKYVELDPEAFHKNDLGRMAEFMATYRSFPDDERDIFLNNAMQSEDPVIRFEALYFSIRFLLEQQDDNDPANDEKMERLLKQAAEANYYAGTALLADYYFSKFRFADTIAVLEPYLKTIDDIHSYLQYIESCAFMKKTDKLMDMEKKLRKKTGFLPLVADYCEILIAYLENDEKKLAANVRKFGTHINTPLLRFIRLRVAIENKSFFEIRTLAQEIFSSPPFHDLQNRALFICLDYICEEMKKPENQKDPSQMADMAKILSGYLYGNKLLTELILMDQYKRKTVKEEYLLTAHDYFPDDTLLLRITAEFLIMEGKTEQALSIIENSLNAGMAANIKNDSRIQFLYVLALDQTGRHDEAAKVFRKLLEQTEFDLELLGQYFYFCLKNNRAEDLASMADRLDVMENGKQEQFGAFFRAAALLLSEDKSKENQALDLLVSTPTSEPEFTFYAASRLCEHDRLDEAEKKFSAITKTYHNPAVIYVNLSIIYHAMGEEKKALEAARTAFEQEKKSMFPAFVYAERLSEANRYEDAVNTLKFPRYAVNFRKDIVDLWCDCMHHVIEKSFADRKYLQTESQSKHLLIVNPDDEIGKEYLKKVREILFPEKKDAGNENSEDASYQNMPPQTGGRE